MTSEARPGGVRSIDTHDRKLFDSVLVTSGGAVTWPRVRKDFLGFGPNGLD
jgi:hypothetical protein